MHQDLDLICPLTLRLYTFTYKDDLFSALPEKRPVISSGIWTEQDRLLVKITYHIELTAAVNCNVEVTSMFTNSGTKIKWTTPLAGEITGQSTKMNFGRVQEFPTPNFILLSFRNSPRLLKRWVHTAPAVKPLSNTSIIRIIKLRANMRREVSLREQRRKKKQVKTLFSDCLLCPKVLPIMPFS